MGKTPQESTKPVEDSLKSDLETALQVVDEIVNEDKRSFDQTQEKQEEKLVVADSTKSTQEAKRPPVLLQRTELLKAIENQSIEIFALIDANPCPKSKYFIFYYSTKFDGL